MSSKAWDLCWSFTSNCYAHTFNKLLMYCKTTCDVSAWIVWTGKWCTSLPIHKLVSLKTNLTGMCTPVQKLWPTHEHFGGRTGVEDGEVVDSNVRCLFTLHFPFHHHLSHPHRLSVTDTRTQLWNAPESLKCLKNQAPKFSRTPPFYCAQAHKAHCSHTAVAATHTLPPTLTSSSTS